MPTREPSPTPHDGLSASELALVAGGTDDGKTKAPRTIDRRATYVQDAPSRCQVDQDTDSYTS